MDIVRLWAPGCESDGRVGIGDKENRKMRRNARREKNFTRLIIRRLGTNWRKDMPVF